MKAPFVYYFQDRNIPKDLDFRFKKMNKRPVSPGPNNQNGGLLVAPFSNCEPPEFSASEYLWKKIKGVDVGIRKNIKPEELAVENTVPGYFVELGDGNQWCIPVALLGTPNFSLPQVESMNEEGVWFWDVQEKYRYLTETAKWFWENDGKALDENQVRNACITLLSINYNVIDIEVAAMGLLTHEAYANMIAALVDKPGLAELAGRSLRSVNRGLWKDGLNPEYKPTFADAEKDAGGANG